MASNNRREHKRHGKHQKQTRNFLKVYSPYLPMLMIVIVGLVLTLISPPKLSNSGVLSYATSMSASELLTATNNDRAAAGVPALRLNSKLTSAAQAKANDMVARDYWSHVTPDGKQPWVFITNAGYSYQAAAENLAYGFSSGSATVAGWMNSPEHKTNMLNSTYVDVGFGYKNSSNFVGSGQETVVVAEYAAPAAAKAAVSAPSTPKTTTSVKSDSTKQPTASVPAAKTSKATATTDKTTKTTSQPTKVATAIEPTTQSVTRVSKLAGYNITWLASATSLVIILSLVALAVRHAYGLGKWFRQGERYVMHHFVFDVTIISLIGLSLIANQSLGFIR